MFVLCDESQKKSEQTKLQKKNSLTERHFLPQSIRRAQTHTHIANAETQMKQINIQCSPFNF